MDDLSYLAGLIDGEGHVGIHKKGTTRHGRPAGRRFVIEVDMTEEKIITWLHANYGGSKRRINKSSHNPRWKTQWRWRVQCGEAVELYARLKPLLKIKNTLPVPTFHKPFKR